jgi:hypothetical protein
MFVLAGGNRSRIVRALHRRRYLSLIILRIKTLFLVDLRLLVSYSLLPGSPLCHSLGSCLYGFSPFEANVNQNQNFAIGSLFCFGRLPPNPAGCRN